jgi:hypothetical protein
MELDEGMHVRHDLFSAQLLLDRARHWDVLHWAWFLNSHPDPLLLYLHGDKDTFLMGFFLANKTREYQQVRGLAVCKLLYLCMRQSAASSAAPACITSEHDMHQTPDDIST